MKHTDYKEWLCLSLYDELNDEEQRLLRSHLEGCDDCRSELSGLRRVHSGLTQTAYAVSDQLLTEARARMHSSLVQSASKRNVLDAIAAIVRDAVTSRYRMAFGGMAMTAIGLFIGYIVFSPSPFRPGTSAGLAERGSIAAAPDSQQSGEHAGARTTEPGASFASDAVGTISNDNARGEAAMRPENFRIIHADAQTGAIEFVYDAVSTMHVSGNVHDEKVRNILIRTLQGEENPGARLRAVDMIMSQSGRTSEIDPALKKALIAALKADENPAVRLAVLDVLAFYRGDTEVQRALANILVSDKNSGVRIAAINILAAARLDGHGLDKSVRAALKKTIHYEKNIFIRNQSRNVLQEESQS